MKFSIKLEIYPRCAWRAEISGIEEFNEQNLIFLAAEIPGVWLQGIESHDVKRRDCKQLMECKTE